MQDNKTTQLAKLLAMGVINQIGHSRNNVKLNFDLSEYPAFADYAPKTSPRRAILYKDDTEYPFIDSARLLPLMGSVVHVRDMKYYYYILTVLERNDKPVFIPMQSLRAVFNDKYTVQACQGFQRLCKAGLLIKQENKKGCFYVNPAFAWKGNRADYLNTSSLPLLSS